MVEYFYRLENYKKLNRGYINQKFFNVIFGEIINQEFLCHLSFINNSSAKVLCHLYLGNETY